MADNVTLDDVPLRDFLRWIDGNPRPILFEGQSRPNGPFNALKLLHHRIAVGAQRDESVSDQEVELLTDAAESLIIEIAASTPDTNAHALLDEYTNKLVAVAVAARENRSKAIGELDALNKRLNMLWSSLLQTARIMPAATSAAGPDLGGLTALQRHIMDALCDRAMTGEQLATQLDCSERSITRHVHTDKKRLGLVELGLVLNDVARGGYLRPDRPPRLSE